MNILRRIMGALLILSVIAPMAYYAWPILVIMFGVMAMVAAMVTGIHLLCTDSEEGKP